MSLRKAYLVPKGEDTGGRSLLTNETLLLSTRSHLYVDAREPPFSLQPERVRIGVYRKSRGEARGGGSGMHLLQLAAQ